jgi:hypothetical protein
MIYNFKKIKNKIFKHKNIIIIIVLVVIMLYFLLKPTTEKFNVGAPGGGWTSTVDSAADQSHRINRIGDVLRDLSKIPGGGPNVHNHVDSGMGDYNVRAARDPVETPPGGQYIPLFRQPFYNSRNLRTEDGRDDHIHGGKLAGTTIIPGVSGRNALQSHGSRPQAISAGLGAVLASNDCAISDTPNKLCSWSDTRSDSTRPECQQKNSWKGAYCECTIDALESPQQHNVTLIDYTTGGRVGTCNHPRTNAPDGTGNPFEYWTRRNIMDLEGFSDTQKGELINAFENKEHDITETIRTTLHYPAETMPGLLGACLTCDLPGSENGGQNDDVHTNPYFDFEKDKYLVPPLPLYEAELAAGDYLLHGQWSDCRTSPPADHLSMRTCIQFDPEDGRGYRMWLHDSWTSAQGTWSPRPNVPGESNHLYTAGGGPIGWWDEERGQVATAADIEQHYNTLDAVTELGSCTCAENR